MLARVDDRALRELHEAGASRGGLAHEGTDLGASGTNSLGIARVLGHPALRHRPPHRCHADNLVTGHDTQPSDAEHGPLGAESGPGRSWNPLAPQGEASARLPA